MRNRTSASTAAVRRPCLPAFSARSIAAVEAKVTAVAAAGYRISQPLPANQ